MKQTVFTCLSKEETLLFKSVNLDLIIKVRFLRQLTGKNNNCLLSCRMIMTTNLTRSGTQLKKILEHFLEIILFDNKKSSYLMSVSILITCLQDNVWILEGNVTC